MPKPSPCFYETSLRNSIVAAKQNMWPSNSPDLNPVDYSVWSSLERNVYRGRKFENTIELKEAILQEWEALPQAIVNNGIDGFRSSVRLVIAENGQHIEKY